MPLASKTIIPESIANTPEKLIKKLEQLQKGTDIEEVRKTLGIKAKTSGVRDIVNPEEKQKAIYGNIVPQMATVKDIEDFRKLLEDQDVIEIIFTEKAKKLANVLPWSASVTQEGPEFVGYLIFYQGKLLRVAKPENFQKKEKETFYISDMLSGALTGGMSQGIKRIK
ncbi:hypothetical protein HYT01_01230 [Candidatus Giovannonibacteria bacterium]|nr:hypothetical protein [Candidatus Giovannonibacteria bacterium]